MIKKNYALKISYRFFVYSANSADSATPTVINKDGGIALKVSRRSSDIFYSIL